MVYILIKTLITSVAVVIVSEVARRSTTFAAVIAALPLTSLLAFIWIYMDTGETARIVELSHALFWLVIPTLLFFLVLPILIRQGNSFWLSMAGACVITILFYGIYYLIGKKLGMPL